MSRALFREANLNYEIRRKLEFLVSNILVFFNESRAVCMRVKIHFVSEMI